MSSALTKRNLSMECCKIAASILVVFNHFRFPGALDGLLNCLCQFGVPMFLATSGYFNYGASKKQVLRRFLHIFQLLILADLFQIGWTCVWTELTGGSTIAYLRAAVPDADELMLWMICNKDSFLGHLWYMAAAMTCYLTLLAYVSFFPEGKIRYQPLYTMGFSLFSVFFVTGILMPAAGMEVSGYVYYNGWLLGLPMFILGIFLHEHQDYIFSVCAMTTRKAVCLCLAGIGVSVWQWWTLDLKGMSFGLPLGVLGLMLTVISHPTPALAKTALGEKLLSRFGLISTGTYLFHLTVGQIYAHFFQYPMQQRFGALEAWLTPPIILILSMALAVVFAWVWPMVCRLRRRWPRLV